MAAGGTRGALHNAVHCESAKAPMRRAWAGCCRHAQPLQEAAAGMGGRQAEEHAVLAGTAVDGVIPVRATAPWGHSRCRKAALLHVGTEATGMGRLRQPLLAPSHGLPVPVLVPGLEEKTNCCCSWAHLRDSGNQKSPKKGAKLPSTRKQRWPKYLCSSPPCVSHLELLIQAKN